MRYYCAFLLVLSLHNFTYSEITNYQIQGNNDFSADTIKVNLLNSIAERFVYVNTDSTIYYASQALQLAQKSGFEKGEGQSYQLITQGNIYSGNYNDAERNSLKARQIFEKLNLHDEKAEVLVKIATVEMYRAEYESAETNLNRALKVFERNQNVLGQAKVKNALGNIAQKRGNYPLASEYLHEALTQYQKAGDEGGAADALNNLGIVFEIQEEFDHALENYFGAYKVYKQLGDKVGEAIGLHNAGIILKKTGHLDSALHNFRHAKIIDAKIGATDGVSYDEKEMGETFILLGRLDSAQYYLSHSLLLAKELQDPVVIVPAIIGLGNIAQKRGNFYLAEKHLMKAYDMAEEFDLKNEQKDAAQLIYEVNKDLKRYENALHFYEISHSIKDSLFNMQNAKRLARAQVKFEYEKERSKLDYLNEIESAERDKTLSEALLIRNTSISIGVIIAIIALFIFINYRHKKKDNSKLLALNKKIEKQKNELHFQAKELYELNKSLSELNQNLEIKVTARTKAVESKNIELAINNKHLEAKNTKLANYAFYNAHKLRAPVASVLGLVDLFMNPSVGETEKEEIIVKIRKSANSLNNVIGEIQKILDEE